MKLGLLGKSRFNANESDLLSVDQRNRAKQIVFFAGILAAHLLANAAKCDQFAVVRNTVWHSRWQHLGANHVRKVVDS